MDTIGLFKRIQDINRIPLCNVVHAKLLQCPTLCNPVDCIPPGSSVHGILQAPLSMEFSRQEYWSGLPFSPPGDLPDPGIKPKAPALQADSSP